MELEVLLFFLSHTDVSLTGIESPKIWRIRLSHADVEGNMVQSVKFLVLLCPAFGTEV